MNYNDALILFGVSSKFTKEELKKRYLELSKKYHPDLNGDEEMMKKVNMAYDILKNDENKSYFTESLNKFEKYKSKLKYSSGSLEAAYKIIINNLIDRLGGADVSPRDEKIIYCELQNKYREYMNKVLASEQINDLIQIDFDQDFDSFVKNLKKIVNSYIVLNLDKYISKVQYPKSSIETRYAEEINLIIQAYNKKKISLIRQEIILNKIKERYQKYEAEILKQSFITDIIDINYEQNFDDFVKDLKNIVDNHIVTKTKQEIDRVAKRTIGACSIANDFPNLIDKIKLNTFVTLIDCNFTKKDEFITIMKKYLSGWVDIYFKRKMLIDLIKDNNLECDSDIQTLINNLNEKFNECNYIEANKVLNSLYDTIQILITRGVDIKNACDNTKAVLKNNFKNKMKVIIDNFDDQATDEISIALQIYDVANEFINDVLNGLKDISLLDRIKELKFDGLEEIDNLRFDSLKKAIYVLDGELENGSPFAKVLDVKDGFVRYFGSANRNCFYVMQFEDFNKNYKPIWDLMKNAEFIGKRSSMMTGIHLYKIGNAMISLCNDRVVIARGPIYTRYKNNVIEGIDEYRNKELVILEVTKYINGLYVKTWNEKRNFGRKRTRNKFDYSKRHNEND